MYESMKVSVLRVHVCCFAQALIVGDFALENPFSWEIVSFCLLAMLDEEG